MPLVNPEYVFAQAIRQKKAIGAFNVSNLETMRAVARAASRAKEPVILQVSLKARQYAGTDNLAAMAESVAEEFAEVEMILHQDHAPTFEDCVSAIEAGFNSVMIDASLLPFEQNVETTKKVVEYAHARGVWVEAELGALIGEQFDSGEGSDVSVGHFTSPDEAKKFVKSTGCDALAVSIGTSHGAYKFKGEPKLDFDRLSKIKAEVPQVPLVLHGASEVPEEDIFTINKFGGQVAIGRGLTPALLREAVLLGVNKINADTELRLAATAGIRQYLAENPADFDPRHYLEAMSKAIEERAFKSIRLFAGF